MRRKSIDLLSEAKKRFQFKPVSSRKQHVQQILGRKTQQLSNVKQKQKQNKNNEISWLDKLISDCDIRTNQIYEPLFQESVRVLQQKQIEDANSVAKSRNNLTITKQKQTNSKNASTKIPLLQKNKNIYIQQKKNKYFCKHNDSCSFTLNNVSDNKKQDTSEGCCLSLSRESTIRNNQKESMTLDKFEPQNADENQAISNQQFQQINSLLHSSKINPSIAFLNQSGSGSNVSDSSHLTVLKIVDNQANTLQNCTVIQNSLQLLNGRQHANGFLNSRSVGRIKKNNIKKINTINTTQSQRNSPQKQYRFLPYQSQKTIEFKTASKDIPQRPSILEQDQNYNLSTSRVIQTKLSQIFDELDINQKGSISRNNCNYIHLNQNIRLLIDSIVRRISSNDISYTKKQFLVEICKIATGFNENLIHSLFTLPVLNFYKKENIENPSIMTEVKPPFQHFQQQQTKKYQNDGFFLNRNYESIRKYTHKKNYQMRPILYQSYNYRVQNQDNNSKFKRRADNHNLWKKNQKNQKEKEINRSTEKYKPQEARSYQNQRKSQTNKIQRNIKVDNICSQFSTKIQSWNSTMRRQHDSYFQSRGKQTEISSFDAAGFQSFSNNRYLLEEQGKRLERLNQRLQKYIQQNIASTKTSFKQLNFLQLERHLPY